jgi:DNA replication protein DnaC
MEQANEILKRIAVATSKGNTPTISSTEATTDGEKNRDKPEEETAKACSICGGLGYLRHDLPVDHPDFGKLVPCACQLEEMAARQTEELRKLSNLEALSRYTFDGFVPQGHALNPEKRRNLQNAFDMARAFAAGPSGWLILVGSYGCGKTHLAAAIANERVTQHQPALFVNVPDLLDHLRATYSPTSSVTYDERFEIVRSAPLLILDDLGTENATPWASEKLYQILNYRYNAQLATVITTNHRLEEIDARLRSRLNDQDLCQIYTILAPDFRGSGRAIDQSELSTLELHRDQSFTNFHERNDLVVKERDNLRRALALAQGYAENPHDWLLLTGGHGSGKTHLAAAIANYRFDQGHPALLITVPDLLDHLRATYSPTSTISYDKRFEELRTAPLLVLDDLGTHSATAWAKEKLYQLLNHRYTARLPTVVTSPLTLDELEQQDPRLFSRLIDPTHCTQFAILAPPYRGSVALAGRHRQRRRKQ